MLHLFGGQYYISRLVHIQHKVLRKLSILDGMPIHKFCHDYTAPSLKYKLPSINSLFDSHEGLLIYKIMSNNITSQYLKFLILLNIKTYTTRYWVPLKTPTPKSRFLLETLFIDFVP